MQLPVEGTLSVSEYRGRPTNPVPFKNGVDDIFSIDSMERGEETRDKFVISAEFPSY